MFLYASRFLFCQPIPQAKPFFAPRSKSHPLVYPNGLCVLADDKWYSTAFLRAGRQQKHQRRRISALAKSRMSRYRPNQSRLFVLMIDPCRSNDLPFLPYAQQGPLLWRSLWETSAVPGSKIRFRQIKYPLQQRIDLPGRRFANSRRDRGWAQHANSA